MNNKQQYNLGQWLRSRIGLVFLAFLAIAIFFLVTEHTAHFFGGLPYLLLLLCPLLHLFMHGGHGEHGRPSESTRYVGHVENTQQNPEGSKR